MLVQLSISNYALIDRLSVKFHPQLNTITGETGAGKSIILGALGLILGNRAEPSVIKDDNSKCIVEGIFDVGSFAIKDFFACNDLDYDRMTILRREITPSGKSRAFINDTPVTLKVLRELALHLIDIHSQHQNLELVSQKFQLDLVDIIAKSQKYLDDYGKEFDRYKSLKEELKVLAEKAEKEKADVDYFTFQYEQLEQVNLVDGEQEKLEEELEKLNHAEEIKGALVRVAGLLDNEQFSVIQNVRESQKSIEQIKEYISEAPELAERLESSFLELKDIIDEASSLADQIEYNPARIETINERLGIIYNLQHKHSVDSVKELIALRDELDEKINAVAGYDGEIERMEMSLKDQLNLLGKKAEKLTEKRKKAFPRIKKSVVDDLRLLGMKKAKLEIEHRNQDEFSPNGRDSVQFLFSANRDVAPLEISKIASGGEMSRLMLSIKNLLRLSKALPTVIFDEIDSGVSGEIAVKMGNIIKSFSSTTQIINITHLPQIAAKGDAHLHVYKFEKNGVTTTSIRQLNDSERVEELAKMVGGENMTVSAINTAQELLNR